MPLKIIRPKSLPDERRKELTDYLMNRYQQAVDARSDQIDEAYARWDRNYRGEPREKKRTLPWYNSSNFVVKLIRIYVDTFIARTLNIIFATRPLYSVDGYPADVKEALEGYLNRKALYEWKHYALCRDLLFRGTKNGTAIAKTILDEKRVIDVRSDLDPDAIQAESPTLIYSGPRTKLIPFEDVYFYPITANDMSEVEIKFHKVRYTGEMAKQKMLDPAIKWDLTEEELNGALQRPRDLKREQAQEDAAIHEYNLEELHLIECSLDYAITNDSSKYFSIVALLCPKLNRMVDLYFNPYPGNVETYHRYAPCPREDLIYGESYCELLEQSQEECSQIHNDRRNASYLGSAPWFKQKAGTSTPNASTSAYPGKVFVVDEMDDLEVFSVGHNIGDLITEEESVYMAAGLLTGQSQEMQGQSQGSQQKPGIYNTGGVMAMLAEGNGRQDTNIRDVREVLSEIAKVNYLLQATFGADDPMIQIFPDQVQAQIKKALQITDVQRVRLARFEVKTSSAGANREAEKASLVQMANVLGTYAQTLQALAPRILGADGSSNPQLKTLLMKILTMQSWMSKRLLRAYGEFDSEEILPDVESILGQQPGPGPANESGSVNGAAALPSRQTLQTMASLPGQLGAGGAGM